MADIGGAGERRDGAPAEHASPALGAIDVAVEREGDLWLLGGEMPPAWRLALWRGNGATLWWDAADPDRNCGVLVSEAPAAAPWIGDAAGAEAASLLADAAADAVPATVRLQRHTPIAIRAREVAFARWRQAWWPASREALVPPLDPRLVAAERAVALDRLAFVATTPRRTLSGPGFVAVTGGASDPDARGIVASSGAGTGTGAGADSAAANDRAALTDRARAAGLIDEPALDSALRELAAAEQRYGALPERPDARHPAVVAELAAAAHALAAERREANASPRTPEAARAVADTGKAGDGALGSAVGADDAGSPHAADSGEATRGANTAGAPRTSEADDARSPRAVVSGGATHDADASGLLGIADADDAALPRAADSGGVAPAAAEAPPASSAIDVLDTALRRAPAFARSSIGGTVDIDRSYTPHGVIDAVAKAHWRVSFRGASATVSIEILAAPRFANEPPLEPDLCASFAGVNARLALRDGVWWAEHPVPLTVLTDPPAEAPLLLYIPEHDRQRPSPDASQLIRIARARLVEPTSPAEAEAAAREIR